MPNFVGMKRSAARALAQQKGLAMIDGNTPNGDDTIVDQDQVAGTRVDLGATVTVKFAPPKVATQTFSGNGDMVEAVNLNSLPGVLTFDCPACSDNTVVKTNGADSLLVNTIGAYHGAHLIDALQGSVTSQITIQASGAWTLTVADLTTSPSSTTSATGSGDTVVNFVGAFSTAAITNNGADNFVVKGYGGSSVELAVNTIGGYAGTVQLTAPGYVQVNSTGAWTITGQ